MITTGLWGDGNRGRSDPTGGAHPGSGLLEILGGLIYLGNPAKFVDELKRAMSLKAGDLMTSRVVSISPDADAEMAATRMLKNNISRIPVIDGDNKLVGIISRRDIMSSLYKED